MIIFIYVSNQYRLWLQGGLWLFPPMACFGLWKIGKLGVCVVCLHVRKFSTVIFSTFSFFYLISPLLPALVNIIALGEIDLII